MDGGFRLLDLLEVLGRHEVDFIVVGGVAASLLGSPLVTQDLDVLYDSTEENHVRLLGALRELAARYDDPAGRHLVPDLTKLATYRMSLLLTKLGRLDLIRVIGDGLVYSDLEPRTVELEVAGRRVRVLDLETLIRIKEEADRPKDRLALLYLRQIRDLTKEG
ncbi:MAG: hypothetical protein D6696_02960 [Acidobacteria bacterium]|nr:MAG: hypothetical protein D6696_02960 [Acidobacteriota bacterium]